MKYFVRIISLAFCVSAIVLAISPSAEARYFVIERFHADISINEDGTIDITETIETDFEKRRHGIYREIPFKYKDEFNEVVLMPISVTSVTREDGSEWTTKISREGNVINIRIGDANQYILGRQVFIIKYQMDNAVMYFEDHDELYWNVTGNYWLTDIENAVADVHLNTKHSNSKNMTACFTGRYGSRATDCNSETYDNGAKFETVNSLSPSQGLTIVFGWDKGLIAEPSALKKFWWSTNLVENWVFIFPIGIFLFMLWHWKKRGRDPRVLESIAPLYEPPKIDKHVLTASQAGALADERMNSRDLTAGIVGLAAKGYLEMQEIEDNDYNLKLLKEPDDNISHFERLLLAKLFRGEKREIKTSELKNKFYKYISELRKTLFDELVSLKCFATRPGRVKRKYVLYGVLVLIVCVFVLFSLSFYSPVKGIVAGILSGFAIIGFANAMPVKTRVGSAAKTRVRGFEEFMTRADKDRIERMGPSLYYEYLPYAIALDVVDSWTDAFEGLLTEPPRWFVTHSKLYPHFSASSFSKSISSASSHLGTAMFSAPRSSGGSGGGGGGGFSGGGGGGGGGGSW